jgi:HEPN domain-containing protein
MKDLKQAKAMLGMANKDLKALEGMKSHEFFDDEIFGFHVQQAIEKALKAWLALLGVEYPYTHDLAVLLHRLAEHGQNVECRWELVEYGSFAVQFRYEAYPGNDAPLDRATAIRQARGLVEYVGELLRER